jgi:hypothetical protein
MFLFCSRDRNKAVWRGGVTMRDESQAHSEAIILRHVLAGLALETKLIRLQRQLQAKNWETQPARASGTAERR